MEPKLWWSWQNLGKEGKFPLDARAWLHYGRETFAVQWVLFQLGFGVRFEITEDYESTVSWSVKIPGLALFFHVDSMHLSKLVGKHFGTGKYPPFEREFAFYWHHNALWLKLWGPEDYSRSDPWWRKMKAWHFDDLLLGKTKYKRSKGISQEVTIQMPEGAYEAWATEELCSWKRPRWFEKTSRYIDIHFEEGQKPPAFNGKGENSWDCGDDGIYSVSFDVGDKLLPEAIEYAKQEYIKRVNQNRARYGTPRQLTK
jgi:hypothetical protein